MKGFIAVAVVCLVIAGVVAHTGKAPESGAKTPTSLTLSDSPALPSPVTQLKQTLSAGRIETSKASLPLLRGDLAQFSDEHLSPDQAPPSRLAELQTRLRRLETLQRHTQPE